MCKSRIETELFNPKSTDIFRDNIVDYCIDRQDSHFESGTYTVFDRMCLTQFAVLCYIELVFKERKDIPSHRTVSVGV